MSEKRHEPRGPYAAVHGDPSIFAIDAKITAHADGCMYLGEIYIWIGGTRFGAYESDLSRWLNPIIGMLAHLRVETPLQIEHTVMDIPPRAALSRIYDVVYGQLDPDDHRAEDHSFLSACVFSPGEAFDECFIAFPSDGRATRALACVMKRGDDHVPQEVHESLVKIECLNALLDGFLDSIPRLPGFIDPRMQT